MQKLRRFLVALSDEPLVDGGMLVGGVLIALGCWNVAHQLGEIVAGGLLLAGSLKLANGPGPD